MRRIGIDVGGTNTDAILIDDGRVARAVKAPTSENVTAGILQALAQLRAVPEGQGEVDAVMIGTTHFINAVVQRRQLTPVGALRIGEPMSGTLPPFCDWPPEVAAIAKGAMASVEGGFEYDGRPIMPLDEAAIRQTARRMGDKGLRAVAITAIFSPIDDGHERRAAEIVAEEIPEAAITLSSDLGRIGLLERENAALLNAALSDLARVTIVAFNQALRDSGITAPLYITQNDGTVAEAAMAMRFPVYSFASGATNSMRGAAYLSQLDDAMVVDVGGTTTDVGQLKQGFPRESNSVVNIGGVRTLFRMPDLLSFGLGGGSHVSLEPLRVGPVSVGYRLVAEGLVFGGEQLTATDIAVAAGKLDLGDVSRVAHLDSATCSRVLEACRRLVEESVDRVKTEAGEVPLIAVGGGAFLVPDRLDGISQVIRVEHGDCANAVGAAIAQVSGEVDQIFRDLSRTEAIAAARELAAERAVAAGASAATLKTIETEDMPLSYLPGNSLRVRVRMVGDVAVDGQ
jgi:N-methylhydantoinase A/oxoprolinase/acetone carboxylase beta subunit